MEVRVKGSILLVFVCAAALAVAGTARAGSACWERVITDWASHNRVAGRYGVSCYRKALARLPEDLRAYSSAPADIQRALQGRLGQAPAAAGPGQAGAAARAGHRHLVLFGLAVVAVAAIAIR